MPVLNLAHFEKTDPKVTKPGADLGSIRYSDLNYSSRIAALVEATKGVGKPLACDPFNDLCNGRRSLAYVMDFVEKR